MENRKKRTLGTSIILLVILLTVATAYISSRQKSDHSILKGNTLSEKQYVCSMHPQVVRDSPGDCPICGMFLIEKIAVDKNSIDSSLNDVVSQVNQTVLASVATVVPVHASLPVTIEASGIVTFDPRKIRSISAKFGGVIEKSFIKYQFQPVKKGQKIFRIYCPEIYIERWNYIKLIQAYPDQDNLTVEAREWFRLLGLTDGQVDSLKRAAKPDYHLPVYSDYDGYVVAPDFNPDTYFLSGESATYGNNSGLTTDKSIELTDGTTVETGNLLFRVVDPVSLRADLKVKTEDIALLKEGQKVILADESMEGHSITGTISQIEPLNGGLFQVVRIFVTDTERHLLPGSQIRGKIVAEDHSALWLPASAVLDLGNRKSVFALQNGKFVATPVETGMRKNDIVEILTGLSSDSEVALNGLMLIDSDGFVNSSL